MFTLIRLFISAFSIICLVVASLTFSSLPLRGKTPYLSLPIIPRPATAKVLAESPSVNIKVQSLELRVPASFASSSFGIPFSLLCFPAEHFFVNFSWSLNLIQDCIASIIPHFST